MKLTLTRSAATGLGGGLNLALAPRVNGQYYLGALANFLQNSGDANVLSTPNIMTLDNEEARILIGNNVPFVTGSYANTTGSSTVNPFQTVERKDVGLMLKVRPQIGENGTVKMAIYQEISKIDDATRNNINGPSFMLDDDTAAKQQARTRAFQRGQAMAQDYARMAGYTGARLLEVSESVQGGGPLPPRPVAYRAVAAQAATPIEPGEVGATVSLTVKYEMTR